MNYINISDDIYNFANISAQKIEQSKSKSVS